MGRTIASGWTAAYLLKYMLLSAYTSLKNGSRRSLMKWIASPVFFISGPRLLSKFGN